MSNSPAAILYDPDGNQLTAPADGALPSSGLVLMGKFGSYARFLAADTNGNLTIIGAGVAGTPGGGVLTIQGDPAGTAIGISATALPLPTGAATETTLSGIKTGTDKLPSDPAREGGNLATLAGKDFATQTTLALVKTDLDNIYTRQADGNQQVQIVQGGNTALVKNTSPGVNDYGLVVRLVNTTGAGADVNVNGWFGVTTPTVGQKTMAASIPIVVASDQAPIPVTTAPGNTVPGIGIGYITTTTTTPAAVRATTYTEQTSNAQRSIASASANDTAAGTGARTAKITYYTATFTGPYTETLTLNGTTGVNTVATNICYIEKIEVLTAGSGGANAGIITLYSAINKGGVAIGTIAASDNRTFWAHHYVATGMILRITSVCVGHNGTTVGSGGLFVLRSTTLGVSGGIDVQVADFVRLYGQSSTITRNYGSPIKLSGPVRVTAWVTPESSTSVIYRAAFDYYEDTV